MAAFHLRFLPPPIPAAGCHSLNKPHFGSTLDIPFPSASPPLHGDPLTLLSLHSPTPSNAPRVHATPSLPEPPTPIPRHPWTPPPSGIPTPKEWEIESAKRGSFKTACRSPLPVGDQALGGAICHTSRGLICSLLGHGARRLHYVHPGIDRQIKMALGDLGGIDAVALGNRSTPEIDVLRST